MKIIVDAYDKIYSCVGDCENTNSYRALDKL